MTTLVRRKEVINWTVDHLQSTLPILGSPAFPGRDIYPFPIIQENQIRRRQK
jgi:hypothetical protein